MTFWDYWSDNRQKILGSVTAAFSVIGGLVAAGAFDKLLSEMAIGWLGVATAIVTGVAGSATVKSGFSNTTKERVAQAAATVAMAEADTARIIDTALHTEPPKE